MKKLITQILMVVMLLLAITGYSQPTGVHITINPSPTLYSVTGGGTYCAGLSGVPVGLSGSETLVTYQIQIGGVNTGLPIAGTGNALNFGNQLIPGIYTVIATSTLTGCSIQMSNSATITVNPIPNILLTASGPVEFCGSGTVTLTANAGSGCTYYWQNNGANIPGANLNQYVATTTAMYTVVATNITTGCSNDNDTMVQVHPLPQVFTVSSSSASFCQGSLGVTINLNGSQTGVNYQLMLNGSASGVPVAGTGLSLNWINQDDPGIYSVVATNNTTLCTNIMTNTPVVIMNPLPANASVITGPTSVCQGSMVAFSTTPVVNATAYIWSVPTGATIMSSTGTSIMVQFGGSTSGDVSVFGQNSCGGGQPFILPVTVNTAPTLNATAADYDICAGETTTLTAGGTGVSFVWSGGLAATQSVVTPILHTTTTYYVTATGLNGCTGSDNVIVTVHALPNASIIGLPNAVCTDQNTVALVGTPTGGIFSGFAVGGNLFYPAVAGPGTVTITYTVTDGYGCVGNAVDYITVNPVPVVSFNSPPGPINVGTPTFDMMQFVYPPNGTFTGPGMIGSIFDPAIAGQGTHTITYMYTNPVTGCSSGQIQYIPVGSVGIDEVDAAVNAIAMFPNPAISQLNLTGINMKEIKTLRIFDLIGKVIYTTDIISESLIINVENFNPGIYLINFMDADGVSVSKKFIKSE